MRKFKTEREMNKDFLLKDGDYKSTKEVFERIAKLIPDKKILANLDKDKNIVYHTSKEILKDIEAVGNGLLDLGLEGKHIALSGDNSYEYFIADMAVVGGVGVITPIDKDAPEDLLTLLLNKCDAEVYICASFMLAKINHIKENLPKLAKIITLDKKVDGYDYLGEIQAKGATLENYYGVKKLDLYKTCQILFTSGTTGTNKGVEICQKNMAANIINCMDVVKGEADEHNTSMSILPMHHATEINTHIMPRIAAGRLTYINDSMKNMMVNIKIFKPYVITIVPMVANMFYKTIWQNATKAGKADKLKKGIKLCNLLKKFGLDITHKLFKDVYEPFGGNLTEIVCGGAPLNPEVVKGMKDLGVFMVNGFGITECGPLVSMNADTINDVNSVGKTCPNLKSKIIEADENGIGELCVKGPSIAKGYYKDAKTTKLVFDKDGYFHTGDYAKIIDGKIYLSGRKKNTIVLENGKNVYPEEIEQEIENSLKYVKEVVVYAAPINGKDGEKTVLCAGIYLDEEQKVEVTQIKNDFINLNKMLSVYKRIGYIDIVENEYEKTSTRKIKREPALAKHTKDKGIII